MLIASPQKLRDQLGWSPQFEGIDDIVGTAWQWHDRYPQGYAGKVAVVT